MERIRDIALTALAPAIWGSSYIVATEGLPGWHPVTVAGLRAILPAVILLFLLRQLPTGVWWVRATVLGALNFSIFWVALFVAAYSLPGGVAATLGAVQPLIVVLLARLALGTPLTLLAVVSAVAGLLGVAMLVLGPEARLDPVGVAAGLVGALSMATATVLLRRWPPPVSPLVLTSWQLGAGAVLLVPAMLLLAPPPPVPTAVNLAAIAWLGIIGAGFTYMLWFRGIGRLGASATAALGLLSPAVAVILGWSFLGERFGPVQTAGLVLVIASILGAQRAAARAGTGRSVPVAEAPG